MRGWSCSVADVVLGSRPIDSRSVEVVEPLGEGLDLFGGEEHHLGLRRGGDAGSVARVGSDRAIGLGGGEHESQDLAGRADGAGRRAALGSLGEEPTDVGSPDGGDGLVAEGREDVDAQDRLRDEGWASHVTAENLVRTWEQVAHGLDTYDATIDDYTNDITARDALAEILGWAEPPFRQEVECRIASADRRIRAATVDDAGAAVGRYFRIETKDGWWWRCRPTSGPLAEWLDR